MGQNKHAKPCNVEVVSGKLLKDKTDFALKKLADQYGIDKRGSMSNMKQKNIIVHNSQKHQKLPSKI